MPGETKNLDRETFDEPDLDRRFTRESGVAREVADIVEPVLEDLGFRLVRVKYSGRDGGTLQIMAERAEGDITVADCARISRELSPVLDVADPIRGTYHLEVSTPGIDRPLVRPRDFQDRAGNEAKVTLHDAVEGRKRFKGRLEGFDNGEVLLKVKLDGWDEARVLGFDVSMIESAKLVLTDDLIKAALSGKPKSD